MRNRAGSCKFAHRLNLVVRRIDEHFYRSVTFGVRSSFRCAPAIVTCMIWSSFSLRFCESSTNCRQAQDPLFLARAVSIRYGPPVCQLRMKNSFAALWSFGLCLCSLLLPAFGQEKAVNVYG
ncbi:MAG: hypothetical protein ACRDRL_01250, partial [Sciscionella sp.]